MQLISIGHIRLNGEGPKVKANSAIRIQILSTRDTVIYSRNYIVKMFYLLKTKFDNRRIKHFMNTLVYLFEIIKLYVFDVLETWR